MNAEGTTRANVERDPSCCNNGVLRAAMRRVGQLYDDVLEPSGLRATQFAILGRLDARFGPTMKDLAADMVMDLSALGRSLKPLERDGLIQIVGDPRDRRVKTVCLTEAGTQKVAEARGLWIHAQHQFESAFGAERSAQLRGALSLLSTPEFSEAFEAAAKRRDAAA